MNVFLRRCTKFVAILCFSSIAPLLFHTGAAAAAGETEILSYKPIEQGAPFVAITYLPYTATALSASVTGPFLIAMQTNYTYGTIDGIHFGNTASTNGQCNVSSEDECGSYLLIEQLPSTAVGLDIGTVTLSNGTSFQIQTNVQTPSLIVDPPSLYSFTLAGGTGDPLRLSLKNASASAVSIGAPSFIDELNHGAASYFAFAGGCGNSLAPGATCVVHVSFSPTTSNEVSGYIQVPTGLGSVDVGFESDGGQPPADLQINPQNIDFPVGADGASPIRTITIKNASQEAESIDIPASSVNIVSNDCATIPAQGSCEIKLQLTVDPHEPFTSGVLEPFVFFVSPYTGPGAGAFTIGIAAYASPGPPSPAVIATSPSTLQFPATPFGQPSAPMTVTVTNVSIRTLTIAIPSVIDFVADPTCAQLLPGASCDVPVRFLPLSGNPAATGSLIFTATDAADPTGLTVAQSQQTIATTGSSIPQASLASPFGVIVAAFDDASNTSLNVTNTSNVPLVFASIAGNRNYYAGEAVVVDTTGCGATLAPNKNAHECDEGVGPSCFLSISS